VRFGAPAGRVAKETHFGAKAQSSKLERLFSLKRGKRDVRALSFELSKMSPQVGLALPGTHTISLGVQKCIT